MEGESFWVRFFGVIQDHSDHGADESTLVTESSARLMHPGPDRSWITDPDLDHPKGMHPLMHVLLLTA